jgi:hypothetical protein
MAIDAAAIKTARVSCEGGSAISASVIRTP